MTLPPKQEVLERERRWLRPAGLFAIGGALLFAAGIVLQQIGLPRADDDAERLTQFHDETAQLIASLVLQGIGVALFSFPLYVLFKAAEGRAERVRGALVAFCFIGPILIGLSTIIFGIGAAQAADEFIDQAPAIEREATETAQAEGADVDEEVEDAREDLAEDSVRATTAADIGGGLRIPALLGMMVALLYTSLWGMRTGLLTRFWGSLGMALGVSLLLLGPFGLLLSVFWFAVLGLRFAGFAPKGLPPAWAAGEAIPWEAPGQEQPAAPDDRDVEGSGRELSEPALPEEGEPGPDRPVGAGPDDAGAEGEPEGETQGQRRKKRKRR